MVAAFGIYIALRYQDLPVKGAIRDTRQPSDLNVPVQFPHYIWQGRKPNSLVE